MSGIEFTRDEPVICIDDKFANKGLLPIVWPIERTVYTVREVLFGERCGPEVPYLLLNEIRNGIPRPFRAEPCFSGRAFLPLRKTSLKPLEAYLLPLTDQKVPA